MAQLKTNIQRVKRSVLDTQGRYKIRTRAIARAFGRDARDNVRANVAARSSGGLFPGYAMTGLLRKRVVTTEPKKVGRGWTVRVWVRLIGRVALYARIHETGGVIRAKNGPYLHFNVQGRWVRVPSVTITRKQYFAKGIKKTRQTFTLNKFKRDIGRV